MPGGFFYAQPLMITRMLQNIETLQRSPVCYPLRVDKAGNATLVHLDEAAYSAASFLDERLLSGGHPSGTCALGDLVQAAASLAPRAHYIFHIGHVGSTLVSRLLGTHAAFFSLREPLLLRSLAHSPHHELVAGGTRLTLENVLGLLGRTWRGQQRAVIKPTSTANVLAARILVGADAPSAVFMFATAVNYLRGILGGENSRVEARALAPARLQRLTQNLLTRPVSTGLSPADTSQSGPVPRSEGELIAMSWLCEMSTLYLAAGGRDTQVHWLDFDAFLQDPSARLTRIYNALGIAPTDGEIHALLSGPLMRQYSKAPEHAYDPDLRREVLLSADWNHAPEIRHGMRWLAAMAERHELVRRILTTAANG